ncbi:glycosyltransferase family protein [Amylibacter sp.]|nr:glycosyltransferase family protein [Amylibacter sp.]
MDKKKYCIFIQARMNSSRSPGKVLEDILGKPMLLRQLQRIEAANKNIDIVCVTSDNPSDDPIELICRKNNFNCFRGSLDNVLDRYISAAKFYNVQNIIRIGGDDPLIDVDQIKILINEHKNTYADFIFTSHYKGWPLGCVSELISVQALKDISEKTGDPLYLEHIIPWFHENSDDYKYIAVNSPNHLRRPNYYFTVDYPEDLKMIKSIFRELLPLGEFFSFSDVINLCDNKPDILDINKHLHEGFNL